VCVWGRRETPERRKAGKPSSFKYLRLAVARECSPDFAPLACATKLPYEVLGLELLAHVGDDLLVAAAVEPPRLKQCLPGIVPSQVTDQCQGQRALKPGPVLARLAMQKHYLAVLQKAEDEGHGVGHTTLPWPMKHTALETDVQPVPRLTP